MLGGIGIPIVAIRQSSYNFISVSSSKTAPYNVHNTKKNINKGNVNNLNCLISYEIQKKYWNIYVLLKNSTPYNTALRI